ncbi:MAG: peptide-binding protein [Chitinophagales bacterium]
MNKKWFVALLCVALVLGLTTVGLAANKNPKGQITVGLLNDIEHFNPILSEEMNATYVLNGVFSQLVRIDDAGNLVPDLADVPTVQNGGISKDGLVYTFKLNKKAKWHDGQPVTSEDVKFTWELIMNPKIEVVSRDGFDKITKIETPDPYTVKMYLKERVADWLLNWAQTQGSIVPKHILGKFKPEEITKGMDFARAPIGSGPFKFVEYKQGSYVVLEANKDYFGKGPFVQKVIYRLGFNSNTLLVALKTGEVDVAQVQPAQAEEAGKIARLALRKDPASTYAHITPDMRKPIFQDKRVRQALNYAIPRQLIVDKILRGIGQPAAGSMAPVMWAYNKNVKPYPFDLNKAAKLLDEAGWKVGKDGIREKDGKPFHIEISTNAENATRTQIEQVLKEEWKKIGIDLEIKNYDGTTLFGDILENIKFDLILFAWVTGASPDEWTMYHSSQIPSPTNQVGQNYSAYKNEEVDKLLAAGRATDDRKERIKIYGRIQEILSQDVPIFPIYYYVNVSLSPKNMVNFRPAAFTNGFTWNMNEWQLK